MASADTDELLSDLKERMDHYREAEFSYPSTEELWEKYAAAGRYDGKEIVFIKQILQTVLPEELRGRTNFLSRLNSEFYKYAQEHKDFFICDINYLSADYGLREWSDPFYWHMYKYALNVNAVPYLALNIANIIKSIYGKNKKGLVLDLDNTLWGGVIGDEGAENIEIGNETSAGQAYSEFQNYLKELKQLGVLLNINSKNDYDNALSGLKHPESVLTPEDFIEIKANWEPKDKNFADIASLLSLMPESLVFVDDNPAERHIVSEQIPGVSAPNIGEAHEYILNIDRNGYFEQTYMSEDDLKRNDMYRDNAKREQLKSHYSDYGEYLSSLEMKAEIKPFEPLYVSRIAQLTNKTNQFNLTTKRYTPEEIEKIAGDKDNITLYGRLEDKFGDNGIVSVVIGRKENDICYIDLWLMSCRVLKRDMEYAMADALVKKCLEEGITETRGYYYPTSKNSMVKDFYRDLGFDLTSESDEGSVWKIKIDKSYKNKNERIKTEG